MSMPFIFDEAGGKCYPAYDNGKVAGCTVGREFMFCKDCGLIPRCPGHGWVGEEPDSSSLTIGAISD